MKKARAIFLNILRSIDYRINRPPQTPMGSWHVCRQMREKKEHLPKFKKGTLVAYD